MPKIETLNTNSYFIHKEKLYIILDTIYCTCTIATAKKSFVFILQIEHEDNFMAVAANETIPIPKYRVA